MVPDPYRDLLVYSYRSPSFAEDFGSCSRVVVAAKGCVASYANSAMGRRSGP